MAFVLALLCAAVVGFAAHRASLCNVRAVAEVMNHGTAHMLTSLMQAVLWTSLVGAALGVIALRAPPPIWLPSSVLWAQLGGFLFGIGAALNGGCSLSTLHRLVDGELGMLWTLLGFALGVVMWALALADVSALGSGVLVPVATVWQRWPAMAPWLLGALALWAVAQGVAFLRLAMKSNPASIGQRLLAPQYPLAVAAALMGLAGGILTATQGAWSYTNHIRTSVLQAWTGGHAPAAAHSALVVALLAGMAASAIQRGQIAWRGLQHTGAWKRHATGGMLMGAGAAMVPGGNDTMLLIALPTLATQAVGAYVAMLLGIGGALWLMQRARVPMATRACAEADCSQTHSPPQHRAQQETPR